MYFPWLFLQQHEWSNSQSYPIDTEVMWCQLNSKKYYKDTISPRESSLRIKCNRFYYSYAGFSFAIYIWK